MRLPTTSRRVRMGAALALRLLVPTAWAGLFLAVYTGAVLTRSGQHLEDRALSASSYPQGVPPLLRLVSEPHLLIALVVVVTIAILRKRLDLAVQAATVIVISNIATQVLKYGVLWRPDFVGIMNENTFPSGHTTAYVSVLLALLIVSPPAVRSLLSVLVTALCSVIASQLLWFGWHRLSDIVGATAVVTCVATLAVLIIPASIAGPPWLRRVIHRSSRPPAQYRPPVETRRPIFELWCARAIAFVLAAALLLALSAFAVAVFAHSSTDYFILLGTEALAVATIASAVLTLTVFLRRLALAPRLPRPVRVP